MKKMSIFLLKKYSFWWGMITYDSLQTQKQCLIAHQPAFHYLSYESHLEFQDSTHRLVHQAQHELILNDMQSVAFV